MTAPDGIEWVSFPAPPINPCDRCGALAQLSSLPAHVFGVGIRHSALVYIQCEACSHRITSDDVLGPDPTFSDISKMIEVVSVWNQKEYRPQWLGQATRVGERLPFE